MIASAAVLGPSKQASRKLIHFCLYAELAQAVVQMLVSSAAPLLGSQRAKERMGMPSTLRFPALMELPNLCVEFLLLAKKVTRT